MIDNNEKKDRRLTAEIISIGDEIISGSLIDSNSAFLSRELVELGIPVLYHSTVGDNLDAMTAIFRAAVLRSDLVIVTGGLGPTEDDLTRQAIAQTAGVELVRDDDSMNRIRHLFSIRGRDMTPSNEIQAFFPAGAEIIHNPHGTAPGFEITINRESLGGSGSAKVMTFPGVPAEMKEMWFGSAKKMVADEEFETVGQQHHIQTRTIHCFGAGESDIESRLPHLIDRHHIPRVGITASSGIISLRIFAEGMNYSQCQAQIESTARIIYVALGDLVFGEGNQTLPSVVGELLGKKKERLGVLEWGSRGFLCENTPASVFAGGLVDSGQGSIRRTLGLTKDATFEQILRVFQSLLDVDAVVAVGPFPTEEEDALPEKFYVPVAALYGDDYQEESFVYGLHPAMVKPIFANRAFNLLRKMILEK